MRPIIEIKNVGKLYRLGQAQPYLALRDVIAGVFRKQPSKEEFWALKDVSFDIAPGDTVGIIGRNGAGKSTLLKILSRITPPTTGSIAMHGRVASLLEVGTGFNPELTGRENVYLNGAILGMTRAEIDAKFDEIVAFSEVGKFLDTPVKRYSSGMYVRLAFSVAADLEPEILIVDEVLAVGDAAFQKKCLGKMGDAASGGRTVLFVSHNMGAVKQLCRRCVWLDGGKVRMAGETEEVIAKYLGENTEASAVVTYPEDPAKKVQICKIAVLNKDGEPSTTLDIAEKFFIEVEYDVREDLHRPNHVGFLLKDSSGLLILHALDVDSNECYYKERGRGRYRSIFELPANLLNKQNMFIDVECGVQSKHNPSAQRDLYYDKREGFSVSFYSGDSFAKKYYGGSRGGLLLYQSKSVISRLH